MVFYAAKTVGYTVIAKSLGVTEEEERSFSGRALPTEYHVFRGVPIESLQKCEGGGFFRVFKLPSGRIAVSHVVYKGKDEYGRSLMNIHALILSESLYRRLSANPYCFIRLFNHPVEEGVLPQLTYDEVLPKLKKVKYPDYLSRKHILLVDVFLEAAKGERIFLILSDNDPVDELIAESLSLLPTSIRCLIYLYSFASDPESAEGFNFIVVPKALETSAIIAEGRKVRLNQEYNLIHDYAKNLEYISVNASISGFISFVEQYLHGSDIERLDALSNYFVYLKEYEKIPVSEFAKKLNFLSSLKKIAGQLQLHGEFEQFENDFISLLRHINKIPDHLYQEVLTVVRKRRDKNLANEILGKFESSKLNAQFTLDLYCMLDRNNVLKIVPMLEYEDISKVVSFFKEKDRRLTEDILRYYGNEALIFQYLIECVTKDIPFNFELIQYIEENEYKKRIFDELLSKGRLGDAKRVLETMIGVQRLDCMKELALKYYEIGKRNTDVFMIDEAIELAKTIGERRFIDKFVIRAIDDGEKRVVDKLIKFVSDEIRIELLRKAVKKDFSDLVYKLFNLLVEKLDKNVLNMVVDYVVSKIKKNAVDENVIKVMRFIVDENLLRKILDAALKKNQFEIMMEIAKRLPYEDVKKRLMEKCYEYGKKTRDVTLLRRSLFLSRELKNEQRELEILEELMKLKKLKSEEILRYLNLAYMYTKGIDKLLKKFLKYGGPYYDAALEFMNKHLEIIDKNKKLLKLILKSSETIYEKRIYKRDKKEKINAIIKEIGKRYPHLARKIEKVFVKEKESEKISKKETSPFYQHKDLSKG